MSTNHSKNLSPAIRRKNDAALRIPVILGALMFLSELWKQYMLYRVLRVPNAVWFFPAQLCDTPMYVCLFLGGWMIFRKEKSGDGFPGVCLTYLATFGLLAGAMSFLDTSGFREYGVLPLVVHSYSWHVVMVLMGLFAAAVLVRGRYRPDFSGAAGLFLGFLLLAGFWNRALSDRGAINMFYVNPKYRMEQVCFSDIARYLEANPGRLPVLTGNNEAILVYILAILLGAAVLGILLSALRAILGQPSTR